MNLRAAALLLAITIAALSTSAPTFAQAPSPDSWIADGKTGCKIRNPAPQPRESVTWSGACPNGIAEGTCRFRRKPATYSDLIAATLPI